MIALIYILLSILIAIEATTSIARKAGYLVGTPTTGLFLQSAMALLSRVVVFMFMPLIGYMADFNLIEPSLIDAMLFLMLVAALLLVVLFQNAITNFCATVIMRMNIHGSLFRGQSVRSNVLTRKIMKRKIYALNKFYLVTWLSYIPYYIAWPITILLLAEFHDSRATVLGLASVFNGVSTIILTMFVDPALAKFGLKRRVIILVYEKILIIRLKSILCAFVVFALLSAYLLISKI